MKKFRTFRKGGVHPNDRKSLSRESAIEVLPIPKELVISFSQHLGAPSRPLKAKGDRVEIGEKIAEASSFISADIHSPVNGIIKDIKDTTLATSVTCGSFVIVPDEEQPKMTWSKHDWTSMSPADLNAKVKDYGIVGLGGATFPAHVKLGIPKGKNAEYLLVNGVECEPYLTADYRLMMERTENIIEGIRITAKIVSAEHVFIGVEANKLDAVEVLQAQIARTKAPIEVVPLKMKYPQGDEKQLIKAITGREVPSGKLPLDVGAVVCNVGTVNAVFEAVCLDKPLFERVVSVTGECIKRPCNILAPIGTKIVDLIDFAGGFSQEPEKLVAGGPMMGFAFWNEETPITKGSSGILALLPEKERKESPCISCGRCVAVCPMGLEPTKLYRYITNGKYDLAMKENLMDCKECGCCSYTCPANLPLVHGMKTGKRLGRKKK